MRNAVTTEVMTVKMGKHGLPVSLSCTLNNITQIKPMNYYYHPVFEKNTTMVPRCHSKLEPSQDVNAGLITLESPKRTAGGELWSDTRFCELMSALFHTKGIKESVRTLACSATCKHMTSENETKATLLLTWPNLPLRLNAGLFVCLFIPK